MSAALKPISFKKPREHAPRISAPRIPGKRHSRYWTERQDAIIRKYYPAGGAAACQAHLPGKGPSSIYQRAATLGVKGKHHSNEGKAHRQYPADIDNRIRAAWPSLIGRGDVVRWADANDLPRWWLTKRATKLGLTKAHKKEPPWTAAELVLLAKIPLHDLTAASRRFRDNGFHRSPTAIGVKAKRQEISRRYNEAYSGSAAATILGVDTKFIANRCITGEIKAGKRGTVRSPQQGGDWWTIKRADLRQFILDNLEQIDIRKVEKFAFVDLIAHPEKEITR